jgi:Ca2+-binding RTX toxin-like protein
MSDRTVTSSSDQPASEELKIAQATNSTGDSVILDKPAAGDVTHVNLQPGQHITLTFDLDAVETVVDENDIIMRFSDGSTIRLEGFAQAASASALPQFVLVDGSSVALPSFLGAAIATAAAPASAIQNSGAGFTPASDAGGPVGLSDLGPLDPTALAYVAPVPDTEVADDGDGAGDDDGSSVRLTQNASLSINDISLIEGGASASFILSLTEAQDQDVSVGWVLQSVTAAPGTDFSGPVSGTAIIRAGDTEATVEVPGVYQAHDDNVAEGDETFVVNLTSVTADDVTIGDSQGLATISDAAGDPTVDAQLVVDRGSVTEDPNSLIAHDFATTTDYPAGDIVESQEFADPAAFMTNLSDLSLQDVHQVTVTFDASSAWFRNSVGYYKIGPNGEITGVELISKDARDSSENTESVVLSNLGTNAQIGFFLLSDGFTVYGDLSAGTIEFQVDDNGTLRPATINDLATDMVLTFTPDADPQNPIVIDGAEIFHSAHSSAGLIGLNEGGQQHVISGIDGNDTNTLILSFEDKPSTSDIDFDFNDVVMRVTVETVPAKIVGQADQSFEFTIADPDNAELAGATVAFTGGKQAGDTLELDGFTVVDGNVIDGAADTGIDLAQDTDGNLIFSGTAALDTYESVLNGVRLGGTGDAGERTVEVQVEDTDGNQSTPVELAVNVYANVLAGSNDDDLLNGTAGADEIYGRGGHDNIVGLGTNDLLDGGTGLDMLHGGNGNDILIGGAGADDLYGGDGADRFIWDAASLDGSVDTVHDFDAAEGDVIDISMVLTGFDANSEIGDFLAATESGGNTHLSIDPSGNGNLAEFAVLEGVTGLDINDLVANNSVDL